MAASAMQQALTELQSQLDRSQQQVLTLTSKVDQLTASHQHLYSESTRLFQKRFDEVQELERKLAQGLFRQQFDLLDLKAMRPDRFGGGRNEAWRPWSKKFKAYCNGRAAGFRAALDWAEKETSEITSLTASPWDKAEQADPKLHWRSRFAGRVGGA